MNRTLRQSFPGPLWAGVMLLLACLSALPAAQMPAGEDSEYVATLWQTDDGLPQNEVTSLAQTPEGYLWIGLLHGGLARFDGVRFTLFTPFNTPELRAVEVLQLATDERGVLWIGPSDGSLTTWSAGRFTLQRSPQRSGGVRLEAVLSCRSNQLLLATYDRSLLIGTPGTNSTDWQVCVPRSAAYQYKPFCADREGTVWYRTADHGLGRFDGTNFVRAAPKTVPLMRSVTALCAGPGGSILAGTSRGIAAWVNGRFEDRTPTNGPVPLPVSNLAASSDGGLWALEGEWLRKSIGRRWTVQMKLSSERFTPANRDLHSDSKGGVWLVDSGKALWHVSAAGRVHKFTEAEGLPSTEITAWLEDREGNVWVGTVRDGLVRLRPRLFHEADTRPLPDKVIRSVAEDKEGTLWLGTGAGNVFAGNGESWQNLNTESLHKGPKVDAVLCPDQENRLWLSTMQFGVLLKQGEQLRRPFPAGAAGAGARVLYADQQGRVWLGSEFGLFYWRDGALRSFPPEEIGRPCHVTGIAEDARGNVWITTAGCDLFRFTSNALTRFHNQDGFDKSRFWCVLPDRAGSVWIGTLGGGLVCFHEGTFTRLTTDEGLPDNNLCQLLEDGQGRLWAGSWSGIFSLQKTQLQEYLHGQRQSINCELYGRSDGLPGVECSGGFQPACWRGKDGRLWFSTMKGAVWLNPSVIHTTPVVPQVVLEEVWVDGKLAAPEPVAGTTSAPRSAARVSPAAVFSSAGHLQLSPGRHYLDFRFAGINLSSPEKVRYRCKLEGVDNDWREIGRNRNASYSGLPPGKFTLAVQACNENNIWNPVVTRLPFTVLPSFWQTWWFKALAALGVLALLLGAHALRMARMREIERLRLRLARDLHDEVGAGLGTIALLGELIEAEHASQDGTKVRQLALQTIDALRDIVWFIDPQFERLNDLVLRIEAVAKSMLPGLELQVRREGEFDSCQLPLPFRRNVIPLLKESLRNITRHSKATRVQIRIQRHSGSFTLEIADNGVGFDPKAPKHGNGLKNIRQRAAAMCGRLDLATTPGAGTRVTLTAPIP